VTGLLFVQVLRVSTRTGWEFCGVLYTIFLHTWCRFYNIWDGKGMPCGLY